MTRRSKKLIRVCNIDVDGIIIIIIIIIMESKDIQGYMQLADS
jgi:hypothetical protein